MKLVPNRIKRELENANYVPTTQITGYVDHIEVNRTMIYKAKPGVFLDIGCSEGAYLVPMNDKAIVIHAFEPLPENVNYLRKQLDTKAFRGLDVDKVVLHAVALSNHNDDHAKLFLNGVNSSTIDVSWRKAKDRAGYEEERAIDVVARTLDSFKLTNVTGCKIDVERHEQFVLEGGRETFMNNKMCLSIETHRDVDCERILSLLHSYGFRVWDVHRARVYKMVVDAGYFCTNDDDIDIEIIDEQNA